MDGSSVSSAYDSKTRTIYIVNVTGDLRIVALAVPICFPDDEYVPPSYEVIEETSDNGDTVTTVACAVAAVVAALMVAFLTMDRRH